MLAVLSERGAYQLDDILLRPVPGDSYFDRRQLERGLLVELEHTPDPRVAKHIAKHHLLEDRDYYKKLRRIHLDGFGDARSDIISALALVMGRDKAEAWMKSLESLIEKKAREGAEAAIPRIKTEVINAVTGKEPEIRAQVETSARAAVKPFFIGAMAAGAVGAFFGIAALVKLKRSRR